MRVEIPSVVLNGNAETGCPVAQALGAAASEFAYDPRLPVCVEGLGFALALIVGNHPARRPLMSLYSRHDAQLQALRPTMFRPQGLQARERNAAWQRVADARLQALRPDGQQPPQQVQEPARNVLLDIAAALSAPMTAQVAVEAFRAGALAVLKALQADPITVAVPETPEQLRALHQQLGGLDAQWHTKFCVALTGSELDLGQGSASPFGQQLVYYEVEPYREDHPQRPVRAVAMVSSALVVLLASLAPDTALSVVDTLGYHHRVQ